MFISDLIFCLGRRMVWLWLELFSCRKSTCTSGTKFSLSITLPVRFDFSVSLPEVQRRTLDVAVKNSGGFLSKDKGLLGKVSWWEANSVNTACCYTRLKSSCDMSLLVLIEAPDWGTKLLKIIDGLDVKLQ